MSDTNQNVIMKSAMSSLLLNLSDMVFIKNTDLVYLGASKSFADHVGIENPEDIVGMTDLEVFKDAALARRYTDDDRHLLSDGVPLVGYVEPISAPGGIRGYCQTSKYLLYDDDGRVIGLYGISHDITRVYEAKLNYEKELHALFELPPAALAAALFDVTNWRVVDSRVGQEVFRGILEYRTIEDFIQNVIDTIIDDEEVRKFYVDFSQTSIKALYDEGKRRTSMEYLRKLPDGEKKWVREDLYFLTDPINGNLCVMAILVDVDEQKQAEYALLRAAERDALTGLYNRESTMEQIRHFLGDEGAAGSHVLYMVDVDNFKLINDTFGHQTGDEVLVEIGAAIRKIFRSRDIVGRIGGDEFFALMKNAEDLQVIRKRAQDLVEALQYVCGEHDIRVELSGSVGISRYCGGGKTLEELYAEADTALYRAKQAGKNRYAFAEISDVHSGLGENQEPMSAIHLRTLLENMDGAMFQTELGADGDIHVTYSSQSQYSAVNREQENGEDWGRDIWGMVLPEDLDSLKAAIREATRSGKVLDHIYRIRSGDGVIKWWHVRGTRLPDQGDGIYRMINVANDITAQKQAEVDLREKNSIIDFAMQNTDVNLWFYDLKTKECTLTENCRRVHEMPDVDVIQDFPDSLLNTGLYRKDCVEPTRELYRKLRETGEGFQHQVWMRKGDGSGWWCEEIMLSAVMGPDGKPSRAMGIGKNVTAMKEMEEKYEAFQTYRKLAEKNTLMSIRMNLTTDWCGDCVSEKGVMNGIRPTGSVDSFFQDAVSHIPWEEEVIRTGTVFSRRRLLDAFNRGETSVNMECRYCTEEDRLVWIKAVVDMMRNPVTGDVEALLYSFNIDYEKNMKFVVEKLLSSDYDFLGLMDANTGYLMVFGEGKDVEGMARNGSFYDEEMPRIFSQLILEEYYEEGVRIMQRDHVIGELDKNGIYICSFPVRSLGRTKEGRKQWKFVYLDESRSQILMTRTDITDVFTAERDALTGLYNRHSFYRHARELLDANPSRRFVLIRWDIDRFKAYNDVYGTQAGDRLLAAMGKNIRKCSYPEPSVFGRIEADHFCTILPGDELDIEKWAEFYKQYFKDINIGYKLTTSVGIYEITDPELDISLMCDRALLALRTVKDSYAKKLARYNDSMWKKLLEEQALVDDMEEALKEEQFVVYFQPQINYDDNSLIGAEALVRWDHPRRGLISPAEFIPLFEKNGFILKLDAYVWEKSCQYLRKWLDCSEEMAPVCVSVNISRYDIYDPELSGKLRSLVEKYDLPVSMLKLEITESAYMDNPEQLLGVVKELQSMGFTVEMDDFGAGYSSLNTLKDVPVDVLKLDVQFLSKGEEDGRGGLILSSVIRMARWLKLPVIAEGVETSAQADYLKSLSCFYMQGYHFGRPMPASEFEDLLRKSKSGIVEQSGADFSGLGTLWDPSAQTSIIFNYLVSGAAILEFNGKVAEIMRANDRFYLELGTSREAYQDKQRRTLDRFEGEHRDTFISMLNEAIETGKEAERDIQSLPQDPGGEPFWTHDRVHLLAQNQGSYLLYLAVENITRRKKLEEQLKLAMERPLFREPGDTPPVSHTE